MKQILLLDWYHLLQVGDAFLRASWLNLQLILQGGKCGILSTILPKL